MFVLEVPEALLTDQLPWATYRHALAAFDSLALAECQNDAGDWLVRRYQREMSRLTVQLRNKKEAVRAAERDAEVPKLYHAYTRVLALHVIEQ